MGLKERLNMLKNNIFKEIAQASKANDVNTVVRLSEDLQRIQNAENQLVSLETSVSRLEKYDLVAKSIPTSFAPLLDKPEARSINRIDTRFAANAAREKLVSDLASSGVYLEKTGRSDRVYSDREGRIYGIAYASEYQRTPRWFHGLPIRVYDVIVFLCEKSDEKIYRFFLLDEFITQYEEYFSSSGNEYKFNIFNPGSNWEISMNRIERVDITQYLEYHEPLTGINHNLDEEEEQIEQKENPPSTDEIMVVKNKRSGLYFILLQEFQNGQDFVINPEGRIIPFVSELFENMEGFKFLRQSDEELINHYQLEKYKEILKQPESEGNDEYQGTDEFNPQQRRPYRRDQAPFGTTTITRDDLIRQIVSTIGALGGRASKREVEATIYKKNKQIFDQDWYQEMVSNNNVPRWQHAIAWAKEMAKHRRLVLPPSRSGRGIWELT